MSYLVQKSAQNAAQRLMMFRAGFSYGGQNLLPTFEKTEQLLRTILNSHSIQFIWDDLQTARSLVALKDQPEWGRIIVNLINILVEVTTKGGTLSLSFSDQNGSVSAHLSLEGNLIELKPDIGLALEGSLAEQDITAHSIQSYLTFLLMEAFPIKLKVIESTSERILLNLQTQASSLQKSGTLF